MNDLISRADLFNKLAKVPIGSYASDERARIYEIINAMPEVRVVDTKQMMMSLYNWWFSSFGQDETDESKAIWIVLQEIEETLGYYTIVEHNDEQNE